MPDGESRSFRPPVPLEASAVCPLCQEQLLPAALEPHLREVHHLHTYRGVHRGREDTLEAILDDLVLPRFQAEAWAALVAFAREQYQEAADSFLVDRLHALLARIPSQERDEAIAGLGPLLARDHPALVPALATTLAGRPLALACAGHLRAPIEREARRILRGLFADQSLRAAARFEALAGVLPQLGERQGGRLILKLIAGQKKKQALEFLRELERHVGPLALIEAFRERLEGRVRMACPRCGDEMRRETMIGHLWTQHRLVLDGLRVRDPWNIVEEWLDTARSLRDPSFVTRSRVAADKIDRQGGKRRLDRLLLVRGLADATTRQALLGEAQEKRSSRCPWCAGLVPMPPEDPVLPVRVREDRLTGGPYNVAIEEEGLRPFLEVVTPAGEIYQGLEPGNALTPRGAAFLYSGIVVLLALLCAMLWPEGRMPVVGPTGLLLLIAWGVHRVVLAAMQMRAPAKERVVEHTWQLLVPELHVRGFERRDSAFAAGLAAWYSRMGRTDAPPEQLATLIRQAEQAYERHELSASHLAMLVRLQIEQAAAEGEDPVWLVVKQLARCFRGKLSLDFAQGLLEDWPAEWWTKGNLARLRILLCDQAFEAGFEVQGLVDAGETAPALGLVLTTQAPRSLAALRLIWSMRPSRSWERLGNVETAFELATNPDRLEALTEHPEVLLFQEDPGMEVVAVTGKEKMSAARIQMTLAGVWMQDVLFSIPPRVIEVRTRTMVNELILGSHVFRSSGDLDALSRQLERWFRWVFHEFQPQVDAVLGWRSPDRAAVLRAWGAVPCPECGKPLLPRLGELGIAVVEEEAKVGEGRS